jgi:hypothetical protein
MCKFEQNYAQPIGNVFLQSSGRPPAKPRGADKRKAAYLALEREQTL